MNIITKIYLHLFLYFFTIGSWFGWGYAEDQVEDLELVLNPRFIDAMTKLSQAIVDDPKFIETIRNTSDDSIL